MPDRIPTSLGLDRLQRKIIACTRCPRLIEYSRKVAIEKRRMYRDENYWGKPLPGFGDPQARLVILGLAPAAHGANRTGRVFTGDRSGDFLFRALYEAGFANQPQGVRRDDGLLLKGCYITDAARCAPPANKPTPEELQRCRPYLIEEFRLLRHMRAVLALGRIGFDAYLGVIYAGSVNCPVRLPARSSLRFGHGVSYALPGGLPRLYASYHPSQQNTQTGKLTPAMLLQVLGDIRMYLDHGSVAGC
ncbi:MAG: uracil-DNA glycosylase [Terriglobia bacterium]